MSDIDSDSCFFMVTIVNEATGSGIIIGTEHGKAFEEVMLKPENM